MRWTERQRRLLAGMGLRLWLPPAAPAGEARGADSAAPKGVDEDDGGGADGAGWDVDAFATALAEAPAAAAPRIAREPAAPIARAPAPAALPPPPIGDPERAARIAALDWDGLQGAVADCRACSLCEGRRNTVFGVGHPRARWMVVGEAPGEQEDERAEPFVGRAGQLLDAMLAALGLSRRAAADGADDPQRQVFIANTLKCRPPRNRNPAPEETAACLAFLERQIELVQPTLILALGRFAVQSLLRSDEPIGRLRGRVHRWRDVPVVVSFHPAYLLRSPADKARAWDDLCLAAETARTAAVALAGAPSR